MASPDMVLRRWLDELWNQEREQTIDDLLAPGAPVHGLLTPENQPLRGPEGFKTAYETFRRAFPDIKITVVHTVTEGDLAAAQCRVRGTHRGDTLGPPTNRVVEFTGMCFVRVAGDQIVEGWNNFDFKSCFEQIALPPSPSGE